MLEAADESLSKDADTETAFPPIVAVGASAGGLEAVKDLFDEATQEDGIAYILIQHLDPNHESLMAELIGRHTDLRVAQAAGGEVIEPNRIYIIPPGHGLTIQRGTLHLTRFEQPRGLRRPIDDFFRALAMDQPGNCACIILSGTGADGTTGLRSVKEHGGICIAQEPSTARYDGMPVSAIGTGLVDFVMAPGKMIGKLVRFFGRTKGDAERHRGATQVADHLEDLCHIVREAIGHDFSRYKRSTVIRRIERRMQVLGIESARGYVDHLRLNGDECEALFRDMLINVTSFFRDAELFQALRTEVIAPLVGLSTSESELRVWAPGCASGEEAYSIAMLFAEEMRLQQRRPLVQVFASDIDDRMLRIAREGRYPQSSLVDIPQEFHALYCIPAEDGFCIAPQVRDMVRFSLHSLIKDPPFSRLDLISCRNLFIYFDERLQADVLPMLHYAVRPGGYLFLGPSETLGRNDNLFDVLNQKARIFRRKEGGPHYPLLLPGLVEGRRREEPQAGRSTTRARLSWEEGVSLRRVAETFAPPSVVIDNTGEIISAHGRLTSYLEFPRGRQAMAVTALARPGLKERLPSLLRSVLESGKRTVVRNVAAVSEFGTQAVEVIADPLPDGTTLLVFRDLNPFEPSSSEGLQELSAASDDPTVALEEELRLTRQRLRATVEELETTNEELKSSNEEMMSMNEELQSTNEELSTVNDELKSKVDQLSVANADIRNFFNSTQLAVLVLDSELRIRNFTDAVVRAFPIKEGDKGRPLADVAPLIDDKRYIQDAMGVIQSGKDIVRVVRSHDGGHFFALHMLPYRELDGRIAGVTLVLSDITEAKLRDRELIAQRERLAVALRVADVGIWVYEPDTGRVIADETQRELFGIHGNTESLVDYLKRIVTDDRERVAMALARAARDEDDFEQTFSIGRRDGDSRIVRSIGRLTDDGGARRIVGASFDVTAETQLGEQREMMLREMNHRVKNLFAVISSLVVLASRTVDSVPTLVKDLQQRLSALSRAHTVAQKNPEVGDRDLRDLIEAVMAPYRGERLMEIEGGDVLIGNRQVTPLALILHEWATNSCKYGAFGNSGARLNIHWSCTDDVVKLQWTEDGVTVREEIKAGFGSRLIAASVRQLQGTLDSGLKSRGFAATLSWPING